MIIMDRNVRNFNTRLRTIRIRELALGIIIAMAITGILMIPFPVIDENDDLFMIVLLIAILLFFVYCLRNTEGISSGIAQIFERKNRNEILYVFAINIIFAFLFVFFIAIIDMYFGMTDPSWVTGFDIDSVNLAPDAFLLSAIASIIFAPLLEEMVFRGVLFNRLKIRVGIVPAMLLSSFLFAIGHDFGGITSAFLFGMCMCILYLKTDNIFIPMAVHCINNIVATFFDLISIDSIATQVPWVFLVGIISLAATVLLIKYIIDETSILKRVYG